MENSTELPSNIQLMSTAIRFLRDRITGWRRFFVTIAVLLMVSVGWLQNLPAILLGDIVDKIIEDISSTFNVLLPTLLLISAVIVGREGLTWIRKYIVENLSTSIEASEIVRTVSHLLTMELTDLADDRIGALNVKINRSINGVIRLIKLVFLDLFPVLIVAAVAIFLATSVHWSVGIIMGVIALAGTSIALRQVQSQKGIRIDLFRVKEDIGAKVTELLMGIEYVRASGAVKAEVTKSQNLAKYLREKEFTHHKYMMSFDAAKQLVEGLGLVSVIGVGAWLATEGIVTTGAVLTFAVLYGSVTAPLREFHKIIDEGFEAILMVYDLEQLYSRPTDSGLDGRRTPLVISENEPIIRCDDLSVEYMTKGGQIQYALKNLSVEIKPGQIVGIVGQSGSGKSTFVKVISGLIPNYLGSAQVFGVEVKQIDKDMLANQLAYIPQSPFLLRGTVRENAVYGAGRFEYDDKQVWQALSDAQISDKVKSVDDGLNYDLVERGFNLSGGERQRIVLARVFLKGAELIILDEATAALDAVNQAQVQSAIERLVKGKTAIIIAHRLSTLRTSDRILVFKDGNIVDDGSYEWLETNSPEFHAIAEEENG